MEWVSKNKWNGFLKEMEWVLKRVGLVSKKVGMVSKKDRMGF
jgi:hypothetical protein